MTLRNVKPKDLVTVEKNGVSFLARVVSVDDATRIQRRINVEPLYSRDMPAGRITYRTATAREVVGHWAYRGGVTL